MPDASPCHRFARTFRPGLVALAVLLAGAVLGACGGSSPSRNAAAAESSRERQAEARAVDFARCLREHGIHAETLSGPDGVHGLKVRGAGPHTMEVAQRVCARYRPDPKKANLSPQQKVELEERMQKFARCMREHGIKVELKTQGGGLQIGIHGHAAGGEPNPGSPGFQRAQSACQKLLPLPPGARRAGQFKDPGKAGRGGSSSLLVP